MIHPLELYWSYESLWSSISWKLGKVLLMLTLTGIVSNNTIQNCIPNAQTTLEQFGYFEIRKSGRIMFDLQLLHL